MPNAMPIAQYGEGEGTDSGMPARLDDNDKCIQSKRFDPR